MESPGGGGKDAGGGVDPRTVHITLEVQDVKQEIGTKIDTPSTEEEK